jgi:hypothetical protein
MPDTDREKTMKTIKIDDPRLDENYATLFAFKKGDIIARKDERAIRGEVVDGVYVGEIPGAKTGAVYSRGKTLYEIRLQDLALHIIEENEAESAVK